MICPSLRNKLSWAAFLGAIFVVAIHTRFYDPVISHRGGGHGGYIK